MLRMIQIMAALAAVFFISSSYATDNYYLCSKTSSTHYSTASNAVSACTTEMQSIVSADQSARNADGQISSITVASGPDLNMNRTPQYQASYNVYVLGCLSNDCQFDPSAYHNFLFAGFSISGYIYNDQDTPDCNTGDKTVTRVVIHAAMSIVPDAVSKDGCGYAIDYSTERDCGVYDDMPTTAIMECVYDATGTGQPLTSNGTNDYIGNSQGDAPLTDTRQNTETSTSTPETVTETDTSTTTTSTDTTTKTDGAGTYVNTTATGSTAVNSTGTSVTTTNTATTTTSKTDSSGTSTTQNTTTTTTPTITVVTTMSGTVTGSTAAGTSTGVTTTTSCTTTADGTKTCTTTSKGSGLSGGSCTGTNCGDGLATEATQQGVLAALKIDDGFVQPDQTALQTPLDTWQQSAIDEISSDVSEETGPLSFAAEFGTRLSIPTGGQCHSLSFSLSVLGSSYTISTPSDFCDVISMIQAALGWLLYVATAFYLLFVFNRETRGGLK
ncbi:hypothetical protein QCD60_23035 [Pokkaliibacter sp. MBI-7]|uniref:hypothetical protein n=1 Tax=Pokkaliibacter sp. MBI-7 TaxID=3040600 RepID=UPI002449996E|nr:hypothetical protein [Pokkaliibacter sp. MBI-7]MDH2435389.1 hypothetical protein [Pokkaliibacter sp. MBI-7]MDH2435396.1 hypothetical protein [Pokkaliibacter sp. MBI-7]MDH2435403.1 hypothetical protein [Pokkaliibacter sp. MBI-7]